MRVLKKVVRQYCAATPTVLLFLPEKNFFIFYSLEKGICQKRMF